MIVDKGQKLSLTSSDGQTVFVRLEVNPRAKRLILRLDTARMEAVAVAPTPRMLKQAAQFAAERVDWISSQLKRVPQKTDLSHGACFPLRGTDCVVSLEGRGRRAVLTGENPHILHVPGDANTTDARVRRFLKAQARKDIEHAVDRYCNMLGVKASRISIKDTRTRWGSCSSKGTLSFSWRLILAPPDTLDYVAAHECAHLLEMNHGPQFWRHVETCRPDWRRERA